MNRKPILAVVSLLAALSTHAQIQVDSGTPNETSNLSVFYESDAVAQIVAQHFSLASPMELSRIETYMGGIGSGLTVQLTTAIGVGTTTGDVLTSFTLASPFPFTSPSDGIWVARDVSLSLAPGDYYLVYSATSGGFLPTKAPNDIGTTFFAGQGDGDINIAFPPASTFLQNGDGTTQIGVRLTSVPEPATTAVLTAAALAGFALWRRKHTAA